MMNYQKLVYVFIFLLIICFAYHKIDKYILDTYENNYEYPKIIWTYWDNIDTIPIIVKDILNARKNKLNNWNIITLDNTNIDEYINEDEYPEKYSTLIPAHKADWIRLYLLKKHGGVWLDAGIIINSVPEFDKLYNDSVNNNSELTCFYLHGRIINNDPNTYIENWYILSPKNSRVINKWYEEFTLAINMGFLNYRHDLSSKDVEADQVYIWGPQDTYLTMHAALQKIIQLKLVDNPKILLYKAEDTMFKLQDMCNWDVNCVIDKLKNDETVKEIPYIKLRGADRQGGNFSIIT